MDLKLTELSFQIKRHIAHRQTLEQKIEEVRAELEQTKQAHAELERDSRMRNLDVDELDQNIRTYQNRLDEGIISFKEMEDLRAKIASDRARIETMEDEALELMDRIEASKETIEGAEDDVRVHVARIEGQIAEIDSQREATQAELDELQAVRQTTAATLPAYLVSQYETLRAEFSEPIVTIRQGTCAGCKLKLSGSTVERVRGGLGIVTCEHCNRMLYVD
jgi:predicted  nucleic acid-binding Zn-ribbon protein